MPLPRASAAASSSSVRCESWADVDYESCNLSDLDPVELFNVCADLAYDTSGLDEMLIAWNDDGSTYDDFVRIATTCIARRPLHLILANIKKATGRDPMEVYRTNPGMFRELLAQNMAKGKMVEHHWEAALGAMLGLLVAVCASVWFVPRLFSKKKRRVAFRPPSGHVATSNDSEHTKNKGRRRRQMPPQYTRTEGAAVAARDNRRDDREGPGRGGSRHGQQKRKKVD